MSFEHQDWTEVRFPNKTEQQRQRVAQQRAQSSLERKAVRELAQDDPASLKLESFDGAFVQRVIQTRVAKGLKQPDLARAIHEDVARIQRFEQRKETYDPRLKAKLATWLSKNSA